MTMRFPRLSRVPALLAVAALGVTLAPVPAASNASPSTVSWAACPADVNKATAPTSLQCGTVRVPLDYADPSGAQIDLFISRLASTDPTKRRGILLLNPGGPGGSGLDLGAVLVKQGLPASVREAYDIIGMDTRGVGRSAPVSCGFTINGPYQGNIPPYAPNDAAVSARAAVAKAVAEQCSRNDTQDRMRHLTTANNARDLDRIRAALGEQRASFLGYSYGSALGAAYASMFPQRSDRMILDSNVGDTHLDENGIRRYALGMEETFPDFAKWLAARNAEYGLGSTPEQVRSTYLATADDLDRTPVMGVDGATFRLAVFGGLFGEKAYQRTADLWKDLRSPAPPQAPPSKDGPLPTDNFQSAFLAVTCNDVAWPRGIETYRRAVEQDRQRYPLYGAAAANILPCAYWPHQPAQPPVAVNDNGPQNVLIMQNVHDVPTPLRGGQLLRDKFSHRSRLITVEDSGHGVYVLGGNACALRIGTAFLVDGALPADQRCAA
jgi:pimeloyl-ACP methyl ester carboxylesterase